MEVVALQLFVRHRKSKATNFILGGRNHLTWSVILVVQGLNIVNHPFLAGVEVSLENTLIVTHMVSNKVTLANLGVMVKLTYYRFGKSNTQKPTICSHGGSNATI
eukprot:Lithocolla_globosa_v1_NODE_327_length_4455_cov_172.448409.p5 type:complete len:105 gc:universal NODE_327_length_4455_cov_172.448409:2402-2088(-)